MKKIWYNYEDIHRAIKQLAEKIQKSEHSFDAMIAIGGGGFIPARILRSFLNIPVYTVTLSYYDVNDCPTDQPQKIQWTNGFDEKLKNKKLHEKRKPKKGVLPADLPFYSAIQVDDWWINYPWDALDIDEHYEHVAAQATSEA